MSKNNGREYFLALEQGRSYQDIAAEYGVSVSTVRRNSRNLV